MDIPIGVVTNIKTALYCMLSLMTHPLSLPCMPHLIKQICHENVTLISCCQLLVIYVDCNITILYMTLS